MGFVRKAYKSIGPTKAPTRRARPRTPRTSASPARLRSGRQTSPAPPWEAAVRSRCPHGPGGAGDCGCSGQPGRAPRPPTQQCPGPRSRPRSRGTARPRAGRTGRTAAALVLTGLLAAACGPSEEHGPVPDPSLDARNAAPDEAPGSGDLLSVPARALAARAERLRRAPAARPAVARRWGLRSAPLAPPPPPVVKPVLTTPEGLRRGPHRPEDGLPHVITRVPTDDRVIFLTIDDGADKDPRLLRMVRELNVPVSAFLTHSLAREDYGYFRRLRDLGAGTQNHTLTHPYLPALPYEKQRREICAQQDNLERETGVRPTMFRPPFGGYDRSTLRAAASCGIEVVPLWNQEVFPGRTEYRRGALDGRFRPGDIVLTHFRGRAHWKGDMRDVLRRVLDQATEEGFAVALLEDYVGGS
ncbi:polysaccharide deacetylase family protein [Streptomyces xinghaiensis]|uniref:polysaccharide deacetylase family protein n=1 Tax=Streptomyces xinghaiensis TaxID=1038928 RepID=UPI002E0F45D0|nr:polysaccharide deacetylase family protein [Streptomyces xinghaiensis]